VSIVRDGIATATDGSSVALAVDSLGIHGDTPGAPAIARAVRSALDGAGIDVRPIGR
jgi:UPF0271 protein